MSISPICQMGAPAHDQDLLKHVRWILPEPLRPPAAAPGAPKLARVHRGPALTADHVIAAPAAKRAAAACGALAVGMEAYPLAAWAAQRGVPFVHGRVILDTVEDALPELGGVLDGYGRLHIRPLLGALARRPALLGEFTRMALRLRGVNRRLARGAWPRLWSRPCSPGQALLAEAVHVVRMLPQGATLWPRCWRCRAAGCAGSHSRAPP